MVTKLYFRFLYILYIFFLIFLHSICTFCWPAFAHIFHFIIYFPIFILLFDQDTIYLFIRMLFGF